MRDERTALLEVVDSPLIQRHDLSAATIENYRLRLIAFARWCEVTTARSATLGDIEGGTVDAFLAHSRLTVSAQTARSSWVALRGLAQYLSDYVEPAVADAEGPLCLSNRYRTTIVPLT